MKTGHEERSKSRALHAKSSVLLGSFSLSSLPSDWPKSMVMTPSLAHFVCSASFLVWNSIFQFLSLSCYGPYCFFPPLDSFSANNARDVTRNLGYSGVLSPALFVPCLPLPPPSTIYQYMNTKILHSIFWLYEAC